MDYQTILSKSSQFYKTHKLDAWVNALPSSVQLSETSLELIKKSEKLGLNQAMIFPDFHTQMLSITGVIEEMAFQPLPDIPADPKFSNPYISDNWNKEPNGRVYQTDSVADLRKTGPYLLFYNLESIPEQTIGKKGNQIAKLFTDNGWNSFTSPELLVAQRFWRENTAANNDEIDQKTLDQFYWVWLVDSGDQNSCCAAFYGLKGVGMYGCKVGSANKNRGANITVVVPLG